MPRRSDVADPWDQPQRAPSTLERRGIVARPLPPTTCRDDYPETFAPAADFAEWIRDTFILGSGPLFDDDHAHLEAARIGVLWTNAINQSKMRHVVATAEVPATMGGGWKRGRHDFQLREWFGTEPDFLLTFSAPDCERMTDREFCAVVDHELRHCAQKEDRHGAPAFDKASGAPLFAIRGHDVEEFIGTVRNFGPTSHDVRDLVAAAAKAPRWDGPTIEVACGVCAERS